MTKLHEIQQALEALGIYKLIKRASLTGGMSGSSTTGATNFTSLLDVPQSYIGEAGKFVRVNIGENGLEFASVSGGSAVWGDITGLLSNQTDLQSALDAKEDIIAPGTVLQYWRGDKTWQTLNTSVIPESGNLYFTDERSQDSVGNILADTNTINLTYTDATPEIKADAITQMSITSDASGLKLTGDATTPGNSKYYGTDGSGIKGFHSLPAVSVAFADITGDPYDNAALTIALDAKVDENAAITGATKTKITYDAKGLVTAGADATTADIADSTNRRYVTDAQLIVISNTSGVNTGDQASIVGITGTKAQFDTALTDGNFLYVGDVSQYTDEMAQDAVGSILDDTSNITLSYVDATPVITADLTDTTVIADSYGSVSSVATFTVDGKGRLTAASSISIQISESQVTNLVTDLGNKQPLDATLTALAAYNTNGLLTQTAADTFTGRTITGTTDRITVTNGNGVSGNPTLDIASTYVGQATITTLGTITTGTWSATTIAANKGGTGFSSYAVGDILYADTTSTLAKLSDVATGNVLISGGVSTAPSWGKVALGTHTTGNYVSSIAKSGDTPLIGNVTLSEGTNITITQVGQDIEIAATGGGGMAIGGTVTSGTTGSILFVGAGPVLAQDNAQFVFDDTNNRFGLGTATPAHKLDIVASGQTRGVNVSNIQSTSNDIYGAHVTVSNTDTSYTYNQVAGYFRSTGSGAINDSIAVDALADADDINNESIGVRGIAYTYGIVGGTVTGSGVGVYGSATTSVGVQGTSSTGIGVSGNAGGAAGVGGNFSSNSSTGKGMYSQQGNASGYSVYAEGGINYFAGNVGIGIITAGAKLDVKSTQTSGTLQIIGAPSIVTLAGNLIGLDLNVATNYSATGRSITGQQIALPTVTNTGSGTYAYRGLIVTGSSIIQQTAAGTTTWNGLDVTMPSQTQTTGSVISTGLKITGGTVTSGTAYAITTSASAGNVGFGTVTPGSKLHVVVAGTADPIIKAEGTGATDSVTVRLINAHANGDISMFVAGSTNAFMGGTAQGDVGIRKSINGKLFFGDSSAADMVIDSSGNVVIGATSTSYKLDVNGTFRATGNSYMAGTLQVDSAVLIGGDLEVDATSVFYANVGINTAADALYGLYTTSTSTTNLSAALLATHPNAISGTGYAGYFSKTGASTTNVGLYAQASGATNNYAGIFENGNVGIGITAPTAKLHVKGAIDDQQLIVQGFSTQTNNIQEWQNSSGIVQSAINPTGFFVGPDDGWSVLPTANVPTYASATTITNPTGIDWTNYIQVGDKVKFTQTTVKYFDVTAVTSTTLTVVAGTTYTVANAAISGFSYSKVELPKGFPNAFAFTPTVTAGIGTFTTVSGSTRYSRHGNMIFLQTTITITTNGTAAGSIIFTLPATAANNTYILVGRANAVSGKILQAVTGTTTASIYTYDNVYPGATGESIKITGWYEAA